MLTMVARAINLSRCHIGLLTFQPILYDVVEQAWLAGSSSVTIVCCYVFEVNLHINNTHVMCNATAQACVL